VPLIDFSPVFSKPINNIIRLKSQPMEIEKWKMKNGKLKMENEK
jgi:hypothetical protein